MNIRNYTQIGAQDPQGIARRSEGHCFSHGKSWMEVALTVRDFLIPPGTLGDDTRVEGFAAVPPIAKR